MNFSDSLKYTDEYSKCPECGSDSVGNGEGTLEITDNIFKRTCKCGWSIERGRRIKIVATASRGKAQIFECWEYDGNQAVSHKYVNVAFLKQMNIVKTTNQSKKAEAFLNTVEGLKFFDSTPHTQIF